MISNLITQDKWKIQLTMAIKLFSSRDSAEPRTMHTKSDNIETIIERETDEFMKELFEFLLQRYQKDLEESMKRIEFIFDGVHLLYYKCHKISLNRGESYIDSPK